MKGTVSKLLALLLAQRNSSISQSQCYVISRVCVEISAAYFRLSLSEPELPADERKAEFQALLAAYLSIYL